MGTLTEFLLARISEDEANARNSLVLYGSGTRFPLGHIQDPKRALAECEAKRRIVEMSASLQADWERLTSHLGPHARVVVADRLLAAIALPYADHPDYRDEWKP